MKINFRRGGRSYAHFCENAWQDVLNGGNVLAKEHEVKIEESGREIISGRGRTHFILHREGVGGGLWLVGLSKVQGKRLYIWVSSSVMNGTGEFWGGQGDQKIRNKSFSWSRSMEKN